MTTFPLIFLGGLVTSHQAGLSVPDWPNSYGYNMFLFPINEWKGGILFEHTHRLMGTLVGFCSVLFFLCAWGVARSPKVRVWLWGAFCVAILATGVAAVTTIARHHDADLGLKSRGAQVAIGFAAIALFVLAAIPARRQEPRGWVRWLSVVMLGGVIFQGILGGLRVVGLKLDLAIVHACFAQAFFCLATFAVVVTSKWWIAADYRGESLAVDGAANAKFSIQKLAIIACVVIYAQLIVGATMRHYHAGLAIPDLPLALGKVIPPTQQDEVTAAWFKAVGGDWVNWQSNEDHPFDGPTVSQVWLAYGHRVGAVAVSIVVIMLIITALRRHSGLFAPAIILAVLLLSQVTLGVLTVLLKKPADIASYHVAVGALVLATTFVLAVRSMRLYSPSFRSVSALPKQSGFDVIARPATA